MEEGGGKERRKGITIPKITIKNIQILFLCVIYMFV